MKTQLEHLKEFLELRNTAPPSLPLASPFILISSLSDYYSTRRSGGEFRWAGGELDARRRRRPLTSDEGASIKAPKARESKRRRHRVGWWMWRGFSPPHPTRESGGASWAHPAGSGAEPWPPTHFWHISDPQNTSGRENSVTLASFFGKNPLSRRLGAWSPPPPRLRPRNCTKIVYLNSKIYRSRDVNVSVC